MLTSRLSPQTSGQAEDPTSSLVLKSNRGYYIDIRVRRRTNPKESELPNEGGPIERLLLARAGRNITDLKGPIETSLMEKRAEWIQGMSLSGKPAGDKGVKDNRKTQRSGSDQVDSMVGQAVIDNPATGEAIEFDELSIDLPISPNSRNGKRTSIVLLLQDQGRNVRGMVVRVGDWCQGLLQIGHDISVERWRWVPGQQPGKGRRRRLFRRPRRQQDENTVTLWGRDLLATRSRHRPSRAGGKSCRKGEWERQVRIGSRLVPCGLTFVESIAPNAVDSVQEGAVVQAGDMIWTVVERYIW